MPDLPSTTAVSPASSTPPVTPSGTNIVVETTLYSVPQRIQQLSRQIEISGTLAQPPNGPTITVNTAIGAMIILLPKLAAMQQDKLIQQLMTLFQTQRPVTIIMQPGSPPTNASLLLPQISTAAQQTAATAYNMASPVSARVVPPLVVNTVLPAVVLPDDAEFLFLPQGAMQGQPQAQGQAAGFSGFQNLSAFIPNVPPATPGNMLAMPVPSYPAPMPGNQPVAAPVQQTVFIEEVLIDPFAQTVLTNPDVPTALANPFVQAAPVNPAVLSPPINPAVLTVPVNPATQTTPASPAVQTVLANLAAQIPAAPSWAAAQAPGIPSLPVMPLAQAVPPPPDAADLFQPGTALVIRVVAIINPTPQGSPPPQIPPLQPNQVLATVVGSGPDGQLVLKAGDATLFVRQPASVQPGAQLIITITPSRDDTPAVFPPGELATLPQLMTALAQIDPAAARQIMAAAMPQPNASLPGVLLFFLSAVKQGDLRNWIGDDAVDILTRAGKFELITRLADEMQQTVQTARDNVVGDWRSYSVPVFDNGQLAMLYFHIHGDHRRHGSPQGKGEGQDMPKQMRFVIDVRMSRLGVMQIDGFLRAKKLDIVMRSERPLPPGFDRELRQTYARTLEAIGYAGTISFQSGRQGWIHVQKAAAGAAIVT